MKNSSLLAVVGFSAAVSGFCSAWLLLPHGVVRGSSDLLTVRGSPDPARAAAEGLPQAPQAQAPAKALPQSQKASGPQPHVHTTLAEGLMAGVPDPASPLPKTVAALSDEALRLTDHLIRAFPRSPDCLEIKARLLHWLGKSEEAVRCWQQCLQLDPNYGYAYQGMGVVAAAKQDYHQAAELLRKATALEPGSFPTRAALADALINAGRAKEAVAVLEDYLRKDPRSYGFFLLGEAYSQMGQQEKARENLEAAVKQYPKYADAYYRLSLVYARLGRQDKAKQCLKKSRVLKAEEGKERRVQKRRYDDLAAASRRVAETYVAAARICFAAGKREEAERLCRRAGALAPKNVECRQGLAWLCRQQARTQEAIAVLKELAAIEPANPAYWLAIGRLEAELLEFAPAEDAFRKATAAAPGNADAPASLAGLYLTWNRHLPEALALARGAVARRPTAANCALLSAACQGNQDRAGALAAMERAAKLDPANPRYRKACEALNRP